MEELILSIMIYSSILKWRQFIAMVFLKIHVLNITKKEFDLETVLANLFLNNHIINLRAWWADVK